MHLRTELALDALNLAPWRHRPSVVIHFFRSKDAIYFDHLREAMQGGEPLDRRRLKVLAEAGMAVFESIEAL